MNSADSAHRHDTRGPIILYQKGNYIVRSGEMKGGELGYYVENTEHSIVQHETSLFFDAIKWANICHDNEEAMLNAPEKPSWPPAGMEKGS